jgi:hypothetical protein
MARHARRMYFMGASAAWDQKYRTLASVLGLNSTAAIESRFPIGAAAWAVWEEYPFALYAS